MNWNLKESCTKLCTSECSFLPTSLQGLKHRVYYWQSWEYKKSMIHQRSLVLVFLIDVGLQSSDYEVCSACEKSEILGFAYF